MCGATSASQRALSVSSREPTALTEKFWCRCAYAVAAGSRSLTAPPTERSCRNGPTPERRSPISACAASGVTWSSSPARTAGAAPPVWTPPCGATTAWYGTSWAPWSSSRPAPSSGSSASFAASASSPRVHGVGLCERAVAAPGDDGQEARELARGALDEPRPVLEQRGVGREDHAAEDDVVDRVGVELERGHDPEVAAGAADGPQEIVVGADAGAVGQHQLGRGHVVDREAVLADEEADPTGGREPADADVAVVAGAHAQPVRRERLRDLAPARAGTEADPARRRIEDLDRVQRAEIDHDAAVVGGAPADAVAAAAHGERHVLLARVASAPRRPRSASAGRRTRPGEPERT